MQDTTQAPGCSLEVGACVPGTPYRVLGSLGRANAGSVYEVEHTELGKRFALKALPPEAARFDTVGRLRNEWRALARLAHPNIVAVSDAGTTPDGLPFFVMERLDGESLRARLEREGRLRASEAIGIAAGVAAALGAAHRIGVVHRDVKPESIFLLRGGRVKLLDFGLAKLHSAPSKLTAHGVMVGTPRYMAPEQAFGEKVDHRADFYALGLVLFEMLAGAAPFDDAEDTGALLLGRTTGPAPSLATRAAGLPADLDALVSALLARDPAARPPDARSIADELQQIGSRLLAPVTHDSPTREACYSADTRPTVVPSAATERDHAPPSKEGEPTRPDGVAARASSAPPPPPAVDPNATALAIPARRAAPPPLPAAMPPLPAAMPAAAPPEPAAASVSPAASSPPAVAMRKVVEPSRRAVAQRAALVGAGAAVLLLCCLALGWVLSGGESVVAHAETHVAAATSAHHRTAARHDAAEAQLTHSAAPAPPAKSARANDSARPKPRAARKPARPARRRAVTRAAHRPGPAKPASSAARTPALATSAQPDTTALVCHPDIPPNPYGELPPSGL